MILMDISSPRTGTNFCTRFSSYLVDTDTKNSFLISIEYYFKALLLTFPLTISSLISFLNSKLCILQGREEYLMYFFNTNPCILNMKIIIL